MSETNRTERRLIDSIRKAKTGNEDQSASGASSNAGSPAGAAMADQPAVRTGSRTARPTSHSAGSAGAAKPPTSARGSKPRTPGKAASAAAPIDTGAAYRSGRRVWPD